MKLELQTTISAPAGSQALLAGVQNSLGFVPNLYALFANSPAALEGYLSIAGAFGKTSLTAVEQQVIAISVSVENECHYCVAAHTTIGKMQKMSPELLEALRGNRPLADAKLEALRQFVKSLVTQRGWVREEEQEAFLAAGYTPVQALEVVLGVAMKTMSNYINHLAATPLEPTFAANAWQSPRAAAAKATTCGNEDCGCAHEKPSDSEATI